MAEPVWRADRGAWQLPQDECPYCHHKTNAASALDDTRPSPGDGSLCIACHALSIFDDELRLRKPSPEELAELSDEPEFLAMLQALDKFRPPPRA